MTVYQLNGLNLPRNSADQFEAGNPIELKDLQKGDLVFFATGNSDRISHVGIYTGDGMFIHAPKKGKTIGRDSLTEGYYQRHYVGGCSYF
jgi:cell wall-associated NlpC family hydrolase